MSNPKRRFLITLGGVVFLSGLLVYVWKRQEHAEELYVLGISSDLRSVAEANQGPESAHLLTGRTNYYKMLLRIDKALAYRPGWSLLNTGKWVFYGPQSQFLVWLQKLSGLDIHPPRSQILVILKDGRAVHGDERKRDADNIEPAWSTLDVRTIRGSPSVNTPLFSNGLPGWTIDQNP